VYMSMTVCKRMIPQIAWLVDFSGQLQSPSNGINFKTLKTTQNTFKLPHSYIQVPYKWLSSLG